MPESDVSGGPASGLRGGATGLSALSGTRFDRIRVGGFLGGIPKSIPFDVAGRTGGGTPCDIATDLLGDAVCAREGGGGGAAGLAASAAL